MNKTNNLTTIKHHAMRGIEMPDLYQVVGA